MGLKGGGAVPLSRSAGNPSNTMWPVRRSTSVPSGVFIHKAVCMPSFVLIRPTVWPQCTNVTDRQDRTGQRTDSIGRTVLQTVAQKLLYKCISEALMHVAAWYHGTHRPKFTKFMQGVSFDWPDPLTQPNFVAIRQKVCEVSLVGKFFFPKK